MQPILQLPHNKMNYEEHEIRQPDEAIYDTLYAPLPNPTNGRRRAARAAAPRAPRAPRRPRAQVQEPVHDYTQDQFQDYNPVQFHDYNPVQFHDTDADLDAAIQASMIELNERAAIDRVLQESAEQYEQDCMANADVSSLTTANLDRLLPIAKTQCQKLGRFDADYLAALHWIERGCMDTIAPTLINKLKQVRLPRAEMDIILSI